MKFDSPFAGGNTSGITSVGADADLLLQAADPLARDIRTVAGGLKRAAGWAALVSLPVLLLYFDVQWLGNIVGEWSVVEFAQLGLLFLIALAFAGLARREPAERRFAVLAAAFFACMLVRETDAFWDSLHDGLWQVLVAALAAGSLAFALRDWRAALSGLARLLASREGMALTLGLVLVLVYSRLLGMGGLWQGLLGEEYLRVFKNAVEEGTELLGYVLVFAASAAYARRRRRRDRDRTPAH